MTREQRLRELVIRWKKSPPEGDSRENIAWHEGLHECADELEAILNEESESWVLVPSEPTNEMLEKGCDEHSCAQGDPYYGEPQLSQYDCRDIYQAMIKAAPARPADGGEK